MIEDENMKKANMLTLLRAKKEYQRKMQQKQQQKQQQKNKVVNPAIEEVKIEQPVVEENTNEKKTRGHKQSAASKNKISTSLSGHKHSAETKEKMREIRLSKYARSVTCITTGETFDSVKSAAEKYGLYDTNIVRCCKGKNKSTGKLNGQPLEWAYTEDYLNNNRIDSIPSDMHSKQF